MKRLQWILIAFLAAALTLGVTVTDYRNRSAGSPVATYQITQQTFATGATAATTATLANINGTVEQIEVVTNDTTNGITYTVAIATANAGAMYSQAAIADNGSTVYRATSDSSDFDAFLCNGTLTLTITPSGAPGSAATLDVILYVR